MAKREPGKSSGIPTPEEEALNGCYWTEGKESVGFPADNVKGSMIIASGAYKAGKTKLTPFVAGSVYLEPAMLSFNTKKYEIDTRRAVVQRQGILRSRPRLPKWQLAFDLVVDDDFPVRELDVLNQILAEAGRRVGVGDYRPAKKGWFGKFKITKWKERNGK